MKTFVQVFVVLLIVLNGISFLLSCFLGNTASIVMTVLNIAILSGIIAMLIKQDEKTEALEARIKGLEAEHGITAEEDDVAETAAEVNADTAE